MSGLTEPQGLLRRTQDWIAGEGLGCIFVYSFRSALTANWTGYCTRHSVTNASLVVITPDDALHVTRLPLHVATAEMNDVAIKHVCAATARWTVGSVADMVKVARAWLGDRPLGSAVALAAYGPDAAVRSPLEREFGPVRDATEELSELAARKNPSDLLRLREAAVVAQEAFDAGVAALRPGARVADAKRAAEEVMSARGSLTWHCFAGATDRAGRSVLNPTDGVLAPGTAVLLEVIPDISLFRPEIVSTVFVGEPSSEAAALYETICTTLGNALSAIGPQHSFADVFDLLMTPLIEAGIPDAEVTRLGHGTGIDNIELPEFIAADDTRPLGSARVLSLHPNAMLDGREHLVRGGTVIVTEAGVEPLFTFPREPLVAA